MSESTVNLTEELLLRAEELSLDKNRQEALNLLKCIHAYRTCPSISSLLKEKPHLVIQLNDIYSLWRRFSRMGKEEISELAMRLISEIYG